MSQAVTGRYWPQRVLLATDLSARCDRALDRAALLAQSWQAALVAVNVLDLDHTPDQVLAWASGATDADLRQLALHELRRNTAGVTVPLSLRVERGGETADLIARVAEEEKADLIVSSVARNEVLGRFLLGSTVEQLARSVSQPLLVVRQRAHQPYRRIVVATDLTRGSLEGLQVAAHLFPGVPLQLYHAHEAPLAGLTARMDEAQAGLAMTEQACEALLVQTPLPPDTTVTIHCERGAVTATLPGFVRRQEVDLVVLGVQGQPALMRALLGSTALRLLQWLPCDVLLVRTD